MIKIANAPCSWGVLEFDLEGEAPDYVQVLNEIVETGYAGTELGDWGFMPTEPEKLSNEIHGRNLVLLGAFVPVFLKDPASHQAGIEVKAIWACNIAGLPNTASSMWTKGWNTMRRGIAGSRSDP